MVEYRRDAGIGCVGVAATGYVGAGWVAFFLSRGVRVRVWARRKEAEAELARALDAMWPDLEQLGLHPNADRHAVAFDTDLAAAMAPCDFVQENSAESLSLKAELYARIDAVLPPDVLVASSTSSLPVTAIQADCRHPERCVLGHPFTPTHLMRLVEVVGGTGTDPVAVDAALSSYAFWGKRPVRLRREVFGHIANRLAGALFREAVNLVDSGVATVADVDTALVEGLGRKWAITGLFQSYHLSGGKGGFARFVESFAPGIQRRWDDLGTPRLDEATLGKLVPQVLAAFADTPIAELEASRAALLVQVQRLLEQSAASPPGPGAPQTAGGRSTVNSSPP